jgi:hypothetical protein
MRDVLSKVLTTTDDGSTDRILAAGFYRERAAHGSNVAEVIVLAEARCDGARSRLFKGHGVDRVGPRREER